MPTRYPKPRYFLQAILLTAIVAGPSLFRPTTADPATVAQQTDDPGERQYTDARQALVRTIENHVRETSSYLGKPVLSPLVIEAMGKVPRHEFVPDWLRGRAYEDRPLPIGHDQTISQPYIVAIMTDLLALQPGCKVLDIGTGSGYQAAILAEICATVYTIEIVEALGLESQARLARLGYENIEVRIGERLFVKKTLPKGKHFDLATDGDVIDAVATSKTSSKNGGPEKLTMAEKLLQKVSHKEPEPPAERPGKRKRPPGKKNR